MRAGELNHRINIKSLQSTQDDSTGAITESWLPFAVNIPAHVRPASVREFVQAGIEQAKVVASVKIRYLAGIKPSMRIEHGTHVYNIEYALEDEDSGREYMTIPVSEVIGG